MRARPQVPFCVGGDLAPAGSLMIATETMSASRNQKSGKYFAKHVRTQSWVPIVRSLAEAAQVKIGLKNSLGYARDTTSRKSVSGAHGYSGPPSMILYAVVSNDA